MPAGFRMNKAQIIGRSHVLSGVNCQDALNFGIIPVKDDTIYYGVICDGCSEGINSEVGAKLASAYIGQQIVNLVRSQTPFFKIPGIIHKRLPEFLRNIVGEIRFDSEEASVDFIKNNLLFTVVSFVLSRDMLMIFVQGDGVTVVNDEVQVCDAKNMPLYIGYSLVDRKFLASSVTALPEGFDVQFFETRLIERFAIASDSLGNELLVVPSIWGNAKSMTLQKKVNAWSWNEHFFKDDLSLIVVERIPEER